MAAVSDDVFSHCRVLPLLYNHVFNYLLLCHNSYTDGCS